MSRLIVLEKIEKKGVEGGGGGEGVVVGEVFQNICYSWIG